MCYCLQMRYSNKNTTHFVNIYLILKKTLAKGRKKYYYITVYHVLNK